MTERTPSASPLTVAIGDALVLSEEALIRRACELSARMAYASTAEREKLETLLGVALREGVLAGAEIGKRLGQEKLWEQKMLRCCCAPDNQDECCPRHGRFATLQDAWDAGREYERTTSAPEPRASDVKDEPGQSRAAGTGLHAAVTGGDTDKRPSSLADRVASAPSGGPTANASPREGLCETCDRAYPVWVAPNALWNAVVRDAGEGEPFLCPTCFAQFAECRGVKPTAWVLAPETSEMFPMLTSQRMGQPTDEAALRADERERCAKALETEKERVFEEEGGMMSEFVMYDVCAAVVRGNRRSPPLLVDLTDEQRLRMTEGSGAAIGRAMHGSKTVTLRGQPSSEEKCECNENGVCWSCLAAGHTVSRPKRAQPPANPTDLPSDDRILHICAGQVERLIGPNTKQLSRLIREVAERMADPTDEALWRVGTKIGNTLYRADEFVGSCTEPMHARELVEDANRGRGRMAQETPACSCALRHGLNGNVTGVNRNPMCDLHGDHRRLRSSEGSPAEIPDGSVGPADECDWCHAIKPDHDSRCPWRKPAINPTTDPTWFDLEIAAEAHVKFFDGPGTAEKHAGDLKKAALAYADAHRMADSSPRADRCIRCGAVNGAHNVGCTEART